MAIEIADAPSRRRREHQFCPDYSEDEIEFMKALDNYKRDNRRPFPTCCEVLNVLRSLGYRKANSAE